MRTKPVLIPTFCCFFIATALGITARPARADFVFQGTDLEQLELRIALDDLAFMSPTANSLLFELRNRPETITFRFATLPYVAEASGNTVTVDKNKLRRWTQIDKPGGGGEALDQAGLKYILGHEALGHILNRLKGQSFDEVKAVTLTNEFRIEANSKRRTGYVDIFQDPNTGRRIPVIPFSDGSKVNITGAQLQPSRSGGRRFVDLGQVGNLNLSGDVDASGNVVLTLDSSRPTSSFELFLPDSLGGTQSVNVIDFNAVLSSSNDTDPFNLIVKELSMDFSSFNYGGISTGINKIRLFRPELTPFGNWDFFQVGSDFSFEFSGEFFFTNDLFLGLGEEGYAVEKFTGQMSAIGNNWSGNADLEGVKFAPAPVPEPSSTLGLLALGTLGTGLALKRQQGV